MIFIPYKNKGYCFLFLFAFLTNTLNYAAAVDTTEVHCCEGSPGYLIAKGITIYFSIELKWEVLHDADWEQISDDNPNYDGAKSNKLTVRNTAPDFDGLKIKSNYFRCIDDYTTYYFKLLIYDTPEKSPVIKKDKGNILICMDTEQVFEFYDWGFTDLNGNIDNVYDEDGKWYSYIPEEIPYDTSQYTFWLETGFDKENEKVCRTRSYLMFEQDITLKIPTIQTVNEQFVNIFPNPANKTVTITINEKSCTDSFLEIRDERGVLKFKSTIYAGRDEISLDTEKIGLKRGLHMVIFTTGNQIIAKKLIIYR